ncbi:MAG: tripartite tricarboxylate transporter permease [Pirellulaceae bacterium]|nr:tripartite tricarboxylate transporter permease [Pirellulaceae bacterium]
MNHALLEAIRQVCSPDVLLVILAAAVYGIFVGAIPGLTATMAVALLVPLTFFLDSVDAVAAIVTTVTCSIFAGDIPATLVRIPGTPASAAYAHDAYALTRQHRHVEALTVSLVFSVLGGMFGTLVLVAAAPLLANVAARFTSYEYFWLFVLGLTCAAVVSDQSRLKGAVALCLGLLLSSVGLGTDYARPRLTLGIEELSTGINFIPAMIGLFGISEVLRNALYLKTQRGEGIVDRNATREVGGEAGADRTKGASEQDEEAGKRGLRRAQREEKTVLGHVLLMAVRRPGALVRSSGIGALVGMLPGAGADIAAWIAYAVSKRFSRHPEQYGHGSVDGLADATGANNAALGGAWIPALVFGIPGDSVTAIAIGVLLMKNITPGPEIFDSVKNPQQATLVYSIYVAFVVTNLLLIPVGLLAVRASSLLISVPRRVLLPIVVLFCLVGAYAMNASYFDVGAMIAMGLLGFVLESRAIPLGPVVLGIILGGEVEHKFVQCVTKSTDWTAFLNSPISIGLAVACLAMWLAPLLMPRRAPKQQAVLNDNG